MLGPSLGCHWLAQLAASAADLGVGLVSVRPTILVIGGGFTGVATAVALARRSTEPVEVTIVEPRAEVGRGVAATRSS
jgi:NADPH-dependent 2,4-dienoyl-CoA reductase/sulfur reductase-like enzyme